MLTTLFSIPVSTGYGELADVESINASDTVDAATVTELTAEAADEMIPVQPETLSNTVTVQVSMPEKGYVYLTFDDGPGKYTGKILEILADYDVKATFFIVGQFASYYPERVRAIYEGGHDIGCHSDTHDYASIYADAGSIGSDIAAWENTVSDALGFVPEERLYRFPGGSNCTALPSERFPELHGEVTDLGYRAFDWNCANNDKWSGGKNADQELSDYLKESVISSMRLSRGDKIMLLHETVSETADMLPWIIEYLTDAGYGFAVLSDYEGEYLFLS